MSEQIRSSEEVLLSLADSHMAAGVQYGLWVERSPSVEEQIALSSMSQDKLGHARAYLQLLRESYDLDPVALQYDRRMNDMRWAHGWTTAFETWQHLVVAQVLFSRALVADVQAFAEQADAAGLAAKISQEETWHTRHGDAWLKSLAGGDEKTRAGLQAAFEDLWPQAVLAFGVEGSERFGDDLKSGARTASDAELRASFLEEVVPLLEEAGLSPGASREGDGWVLDPAPSAELLAQVREANEENALELLALIQDPEGREMAEL